MGEEKSIYHLAATGEMEKILASPSASNWLKKSLLAALDSDPVDVANDAEVLAGVLARRCRSVLNQDLTSA